MNGKDIADFILIPFRVLFTPNKFFADLSPVNRWGQFIKPLFFLIIVGVSFIALNYFAVCFRYGTYDFTYIIEHLFMEAKLFPGVFIVMILAVILWFVFFSLVLSFIGDGMGSKASYSTSFQAVAYTSTLFLLFMISVVLLELTKNNYIILSVLSFIAIWGVYPLMVISKQVYKIEDVERHLIIGIIGGVVMVPFYFLAVLIPSLH